MIVDSTGLKVYGKDEWHQEKHDVPARRTWRRLHLAIDENHNVLACELTTPEAGDPTAVPDLLDQNTAPFDTFMGDGAYDGEPVSQAVLNKQHHESTCAATAKNGSMDQVRLHSTE
ncbi:MAG: transposase [Methylobacter sp.]